MNRKELKLLDDVILTTQTPIGKAEAFDELVLRHQTMVINLCARFLNNHQDAIDAAQDIFIKVYYALDTFKPEAQFSTWLYRISINHCLNILRSRKRKAWFSLFSAKSGNYQDEVLSIEDHDSNPETELLNNEKYAAVNKAVASLPESYRTVIILHRFQGLSYQEIATILDTSIATVESRLHRAKRKLVQLLADYLYD